MIRIFVASGILLVSAFTAFSFTPVGDQLALVIVSQTDDYQGCLDELKKMYPGQNIEQNYQVARARVDATNSTPDLIFTLTDDATCGTNGCIHEICLRSKNESNLMNFGMAARSLEVLGSSSEGMYDLKLTSSNNFILTWDGERYTIAD